MGGTEAIVGDTPYPQVEVAKELLSSKRDEKLSTILVELDNMVLVPVVCGVVWSPRHSNCSISIHLGSNLPLPFPLACCPCCCW